LQLQVLLAGDGDVGAHHRKIPVRLPGEGIGQKAEGAAGLTEAGVQGPAAVGILMLIEGVGLGGHRPRIPFHRHCDLAAHPGLQRLGVLGAHREVQGPGAAFREAVQPEFRVGQGHRRGQHHRVHLQVVARLPVGVELVAGGGAIGFTAQVAKVDIPLQVEKIQGIAQGAVSVKRLGQVSPIGREGPGSSGTYNLQGG